MPEVRGLDYATPPLRPFFYEAPVFTRAEVYWDCWIGAHSYINGGLVREHTDIGRFCSIGHGVALAAGDHPLNMVSTHSFASKATRDDAHVSPYPNARKARERTVIEHDVWIGANVVVRG